MQKVEEKYLFSLFFFQRFEIPVNALAEVFHICLIHSSKAIIFSYLIIPLHLIIDFTHSSLPIDCEKGS